MTSPVDAIMAAEFPNSCRRASELLRYARRIGEPRTCRLTAEEIALKDELEISAAVLERHADEVAVPLDDAAPSWTRDRRRKDRNLLGRAKTRFRKAVRAAQLHYEGDDS